MINVRVLENRIKLGLVEGKKLENTQETLNKIKYTTHSLIHLLTNLKVHSKLIIHSLSII